MEGDNNVTSESVAPNLTLVKPKGDRFWVMCKRRKCFWLKELKSADAARIKAFAHVSTHPGHSVEFHTVRTEVIRGKKS